MGKSTLFWIGSWFIRNHMGKNTLFWIGSSARFPRGDNERGVWWKKGKGEMENGGLRW